MNNVQSFIDRQYGNYSWRSYDTAIHRLRCTKEDEFQGITLQDSTDQVDPPIFACKFAQIAGYDHILALANEEGEIAIHNTEHKDSDALAKRYSMNAHFNAIFDVAWMFGQMKLVSVSGDHTARLFDVSRGDIVEEKIFHGHTRSVKTVAFRKNDPAVFATGSRDGAIFVWDTRATVNNHYVTQPDTVISNSHNIPNTPSSGSKFKKKFQTNHNVSAANSVTSIVFQDDNTLISCGAGDGVIKVWDLRKNYLNHKRDPLPKYTLPYVGNTTRNGFSNLLVDSSGVKLYANCMDSNIYCYNISTYDPNPVMTYVGHQNCSFYIKSSLSADGRYLLSGSSDQNAYIWNTNKSTPLVSLTGHTAEVTCVAWCQRGNMKMVTCSDDMTHKIWRIHDGDLPDDWTIEGRGNAVPIADKQETKLFHTPSSRKRSMSSTPHSQRKRSKICEQCQMLTPGSAASMRCQNCITAGCRSSKRSASQAELSPGNESKRQNSEKNTPRRLFSSLYDPSSSRNCDGELATILEEISPTKNIQSDNHQSTSNFFSPTANLPNFVIDGEAPHLKNYSPKKKVDKDWLTKMRTEQSLRTQLAELSNPSSPKQPRLVDTSIYVSPKSSNSVKKQKRTTPSNSRAQSPLLKFFRVTNNSSRSCDCHCSPLSSMNSSLSSELRHVN